MASLWTFARAQGSFNVRKQKLIPVFIDSMQEAVFVYEVSNAIIIFRQKDIADILNVIKNNAPFFIKNIDKFRGTLHTNTDKIRVRDILYSYDQHQRDSILSRVRIASAEMELNENFYFIGAELKLKGKFMICSKETKRIINRHLTARRCKGVMGGSNLAFLLPNGELFYDIIISIGD